MGPIASHYPSVTGPAHTSLVHLFALDCNSNRPTAEEDPNPMPGAKLDGKVIPQFQVIERDDGRWVLCHDREPIYVLPERYGSGKKATSRQLHEAGVDG
jgi:hypothetical protein